MVIFFGPTLSGMLTKFQSHRESVEQFVVSSARSQWPTKPAPQVAHRKLDVALGEGQKLVQWSWLVLRHNPDLCETVM
jgi:hypothetical protein